MAANVGGIDKILRIVAGAGLVGWAIEQGGRDNITVGVVRVGG